MGLPSGDTVFDYRDRAIIKFFLYSGARIGTACRLRVKDFHQDGDEATVTLHEKGDKHRRIGLHFAAAEAIAAYIAKAELSKGPLFQPGSTRGAKSWVCRLSARSRCITWSSATSRLPASMREEEVTDEDGTVKKVKRASTRRIRCGRPRRRCSSMPGWTSSRWRSARPPARDHHPDLRQAAARPQGRGVARRADLTDRPCPRPGDRAARLLH